MCIHSAMSGWRRRGRLTAALIVLLAIVACDRIRPDSPDFTLPPVEVVDSIYREHGLDLDVSYSGNVVELRAVQPPEQLQRGGTLWARVGPYVYLLTPATEAVFAKWEGVAGVRAITTTPSGDEIARALLLRTALAEPQWRRAQNLLGQALREGTERPSRVEALVRFGEEHTEHEYNARYVPREQTEDGG